MRGISWHAEGNVSFEDKRIVERAYCDVVDDRSAYILRSPWGEGATFLRNVGNHCLSDTASHSGRRQTSETPLRRTQVPHIICHSSRTQSSQPFRHTHKQPPTSRNLDRRMGFVQKNSEMDQAAARGRSGFINVLWFLFFIKQFRCS